MSSGRDGRFRCERPAPVSPYGRAADRLAIRINPHRTAGRRTTSKADVATIVIFQGIERQSARADGIRCGPWRGLQHLRGRAGCRRVPRSRPSVAHQAPALSG